MRFSHDPENRRVDFLPCGEIADIHARPSRTTADKRSLTRMVCTRNALDIGPEARAEGPGSAEPGPSFCAGGPSYTNLERRL